MIFPDRFPTAFLTPTPLLAVAYGTIASKQPRSGQPLCRPGGSRGCRLDFPARVWRNADVRQKYTMSRNTQASLITLVLMCAGALAYEHFIRVPAMVILFVVLFGPISFLLWRKENLRDYDSKGLLKYCGKAILVSIGLAILCTVLVFLYSLIGPPDEKITGGHVWGAFVIFVVVAGIVPVFILLSLLRLGIRHALDSLFGSPHRADER
jgi:hypothetical protein